MNKYLLLISILFIHYKSFSYSQVSNLITPVSYFVNHVKQLSDIKNNLNKYKVTSIVGISGIGKTQLARMYAYENIEDYNIIWFFDCNTDINIEFVKLAKALNQQLNAGVSVSPLSAKNDVLEYLVHKDKWLLVFDNLKIHQNSKVQDLINWENNGNIIFCSQDNEMLPYTTEATAFSKRDTKILASNILENKEPQLIEFLAQEFKGYPILIVQAAQLINKIRGLDQGEYKNKIQQSADGIKLNITLAIKELTPSAEILLHKISLINHRSFSKQMLDVVTEDKTHLLDDIYQLSKFMLISNISTDEGNPIFEMHDIIAKKLLEIYGSKNNKSVIEDIITKITKVLPVSMHAGHVFRNSITVKENLEIIAAHAKEYNINILKLMPLNVSLFTDYVNTMQYYEAEKLFDWFDSLEKANAFHTWKMSNDNKFYYARYLGMSGGYYKNRYVDWGKALEYYIKANQILSEVNGYEAIKCNLLYNLANAHISLGQISEAEKRIKAMEKMFQDSVLSAKEIGMLHLIKAKLYHYKGDNKLALEESDKDIEETSKTGIKLDDMFFTISYVLRLRILNTLGMYKDAHLLAEHLYNMHKPTKAEDHEIFARIYTEMAESELGLGNISIASEYINKAIIIFLKNNNRFAEDADYFGDIDLAISYVVQANVFVAQDNLIKAVEAYKKAQIIYYYLYKNKTHEIEHVSYLYTQGAKISCKANDLYNYKSFGEAQIKEFGIKHHNTLNMLEYCKNYSMDLWSEEN